MTQSWTEEDIAAFVDGALEEDEALRIAAIIEEDPEARAVAEEIEHSNALLGAAYADVLTAPVPNALSDLLHPNDGNVVPLRRQPRRIPAWVPSAAAASVAIVVGLAIGWSFESPTVPSAVGLGDAPSGGELELALNTVPSGTMHDDRFMPMLTFRDSQGRYCREFEVFGDLPDEIQFGIACRTPADAWHVEIIVTAPQAERDTEGFVPASGPGADALEAMLDALGAGLPLTNDQERRAIEEGWKQN